MNSSKFSSGHKKANQGTHLRRRFFDFDPKFWRKNHAELKKITPVRWTRTSSYLEFIFMMYLTLIDYGCMCYFLLHYIIYIIFIRYSSLGNNPDCWRVAFSNPVAKMPKFALSLPSLMLLKD